MPPDGAVIPRPAFSQRLRGKVFRVVVDQVRGHRSFRQPQASDVMDFIGFFFRRQLPPSVYQFTRIAKLFQPPTPGAPLRRLHGSSRFRVAEKGPWGKSRGPEQQYQLTDLDKADALVGLNSKQTQLDASESLFCAKIAFTFVSPLDKSNRTVFTRNRSVEQTC